MTKIVVLGAGIGGISAAYELREKFSKKAEIVVLSDSEWFQFVPSNPWVALKWRKPDQIRVHLPGVLKKLKIGFNASGASRLVPAENVVEMRDGTRVTYDFLVIATGPELAFDEVEGLGPQANGVSICHIDHAATTAERWEAFCADPGPIVVGAAAGASCFGPAYEFAMLMNADLRKRKIRNKVPMTFVTPEPYIGHLGLGGVGDTKGMLESAMRDRDIRWVTNAKVDKVAADGVELTEMNEDGSSKGPQKIASKLTMLIPAFRGVACMRGTDGKYIAGLTNPRGFVLVDKFQRNPTFPNIYAVGVCVAIPPVEKTAVPVGVPKTGYMIESMVTASVANIAEAAEGREPTRQATWNAVCLADFGDDGVAFVALPQIPPRNVNWAGQGYWVHVAKVGFEKYFLRKVRRGSTEPGFERMIMKMIGVEKLLRSPRAA